MWPLNKNEQALRNDHLEKKARRERIRLIKDQVAMSQNRGSSNGEILSHSKWLEKYGRLKDKYVKLRDRVCNGELFKRKFEESEKIIQKLKNREAAMKQEIRKLNEKLEISTEMILQLKNKEENLEAHNTSMSNILKAIPEYSYYGKWSNE